MTCIPYLLYTIEYILNQGIASNTKEDKNECVMCILGWQFLRLTWFWLACLLWVIGKWIFSYLCHFECLRSFKTTYIEYFYANHSDIKISVVISIWHKAGVKSILWNIGNLTQASEFLPQNVITGFCTNSTRVICHLQWHILLSFQYVNHSEIKIPVELSKWICTVNFGSCRYRYYIWISTKFHK